MHLDSMQTYNKHIDKTSPIPNTLSLFDQMGQTQWDITNYIKHSTTKLQLAAHLTLTFSIYMTKQTHYHYKNTWNFTPYNHNMIALNLPIPLFCKAHNTQTKETNYFQ